MPNLWTLPLAWDIPPGTIISIVFLVLYTVAQLLGSREQKPQPKRPPRPPRPPRGQAPNAGQRGKPADLEDALRQEVDAFLRRASGQEPKPAEAKQQSMPGEGSGRVRPARTPRRIATSRPPLPSAAESSADAEPVLVPLRQSSVADHVSQHIGSSSQAIAEHTSHLGETVSLADDRMEEHLRTKFGGELGSLRRQASAPEEAEAESPLAEEIRRMLSDPDGVRQLIIANEILQRPTDRW